MNERPPKRRWRGRRRNPLAESAFTAHPWGDTSPSEELDNDTTNLQKETSKMFERGKTPKF